MDDTMRFLYKRNEGSNYFGYSIYGLTNDLSEELIKDETFHLILQHFFQEIVNIIN